MQKYFGPEGILASKVQGFEFRQVQLEMAEAVFECFRSETPLIAEAGTGTGKTLAYLVPAILSGKKVVVSTGTKTLQDQILDNDIPFLKKNIDPKLHAVCLKGRRNYLCRRRFLCRFPCPCQCPCPYQCPCLAVCCRCPDWEPTTWKFPLLRKKP